MLPQLSQFPVALSVTCGFHTSCRQGGARTRCRAQFLSPPRHSCVLPVCAHRCCCRSCRACSVRCCMFLLLGGCLSASSFSASRYSLASPEGLLFCLRLSASAPLPSTAPLSLPPFPFIAPPRNTFLVCFHDGLIHAPIGKVACCALFAAANRLLNHQQDDRVRRLPALLLWTCTWCCSESGTVSGLGVRCRNYWPGQYHSGSGARLPPPRRRRPPVSFPSHRLAPAAD